MRRQRAVATIGVLLAAGCATSPHSAATSAPPTAPPATTVPATTPPATTSPPTGAARATTAPVTVPSLVVHPAVAVRPPFSATVSGPLTPADVPSSWRPGCPVPPSALRMIHLRYVGFDHLAHIGAIVVNAAVAPAVIRVFRTLYVYAFPIRRLQPVDAYHGSDSASANADNSSGFNCRYAVAPGPPSWSVHAYGEAIDVNDVENPYVQPGQPVLPPAGAAYLNRSDHRPGMAYWSGILVRAFYAVGWQWGGRWTSSPDYQHFSANGR